MKILEYMGKYEHEQLILCHEPSVGLRALIAIHDTSLGPACGGVRIWPHQTEKDAFIDVLRLAKSMTYKSALAGLPLGGGKALIIADPLTDKNEALLKAFGQHVDTLGGRYIATEDVGMTPEDLVPISQETKYVVGLPLSMGGSGDTSIMTGLGVYLGMKACATKVWGSDSLNGKVVAIQGFGNVGANLAKHLVNEGARLLVTDINEISLCRARDLGATIIEPDSIYEVECDIFSPCALGGILNSKTIPTIRSAIVAGGANNQLLHDIDGVKLHKRGILYAPDYLINAGGIINASCEINQTYQPQRAKEMTERIYETMDRVISISSERNTPTSTTADQMARSRLGKIQKPKKIYRNHVTTNTSG